MPLVHELAILFARLGTGYVQALLKPAPPQVDSVHQSRVWLYIGCSLVGSWRHLPERCLTIRLELPVFCVLLGKQQSPVDVLTVAVQHLTHCRWKLRNVPSLIFILLSGRPHAASNAQTMGPVQRPPTC